MVRESTSRQKMLLNVSKHLKKQHSYLSLDFVPKMSFLAPYCTTKYPSTTLGTNGSKTWQRRKKGQVAPEQEGIKSNDALGRVYTMHPTNSECFHLRLLLHEVACKTYKQAC
ncbi:hypothetical protein AVEN_128488-1 [Araneus ventricosus]|uniref:Uncharacterized protein n=1 Tax=Araneus ventricosus TaxID=182803 RepID=A0A4Y2FPQ3_ARAVE|nr:hypothetical protein AVEN_128488-1 [Araneus ventricosus]